MEYCGAHLLPQGPAGRPDPVGVVVVGRGSGHRQVHAVVVLRSQVAEELGGLQEPGFGPAVEAHVFGRAKGHQGQRNGVNRLLNHRTISTLRG